MSAPSVYLVSSASADPVPADLPPYAAALGLRSNPFPVTPDETNYFFTPETESICEELSHFIAMRKGFLLLTGEIGLGKTTLLRRLLASLDEAHYNSALVLTSFLDQSELLETIARDFGLQLPPGARRIDHLAALNQFLMSQAQAGKINVLFIDDAQALDAQALDVVRQLSNLETAQQKLIQVVLCGQPELLDTLWQHSLRQVKSRIALHRQLRPLDRAQTLAYIRHRMAKAGSADCVEISDDGLQSLHELSAGFPRRIHHLMDRCLYATLAADTRRIDRALVLRAWDDMGLHSSNPAATSLPPSGRSWLRGQAVVLWLVLFAVLALLLGTWFASAPQRAASAPNPLAAPSDWTKRSSAFAGLTLPAWPAVSSVPALSAQLNTALQKQGWQALVGPGEWVAPCDERPLLAVRDAQGALWNLSFVESGWPTAALVMGTSSAPVRALQRMLAAQGLLDDAQVDAVMGPRTAFALSQFQREQGLAATGQFTPETAYRLSCSLAENPPLAAGAAP